MYLYKDIRIFDAHFHIIDPRFALVENNGYLPNNFTCNEYLSQLEGVNLIGGAVISGSFQGYDQNYLKAALKELGPAYVGVIQVSPNIFDDEILDLHELGVRAIRFNLKRLNNFKMSELVNLAHRVYEIAGWHIELYLDSNDLMDLYQELIKLPSVSIDHLGLTKSGFNELLKLASKGVHVKASGFGRVDFDVTNALQQLYSVNTHCLMFGTDLPSTRAPRPFNSKDIEIILNNFDQADVENILYKNAVSLYKVE